MSDGIWSAASGAIGQILALDVAADNVANAATPAHQGQRAVFNEYMTRAAQAGGPTAKGNLHYGGVGNIVVDTTPGAMLPTGRPLDAALRGDGYFAVRTAQGDRYTRHGSFQIANDGRLVTSAGETVLGTDRRPIRVEMKPGAQAAIGSDGVLRIDGEQAGSLLVVSFPTPSGLEREGASLLRATPKAGQAKAVDAQLEPGSLELSNVSPVKGMIEIVNASRSFEACERAIDAFRDADRRAAVDIVGRS